MRSIISGLGFFGTATGRQERQATTLAQTGSYVRGLDGIRAIAVSLVFFGHYKVIGAGAMFGVQLFFVVSGFIISRVLMREFNASGTIDIGRFYIRRFLRLSPPMLLTLAVIIPAWIYLGRSLQWGDILASVFYYSNYYQLWHVTDLYYMPLWSLAIEEHYYLVFCFAFLLYLKSPLRKVIWPVVLACLAVAVWRYTLFLWSPDAVRETYMRTDTRVDGLLWGVSLSLLVMNGRSLGQSRDQLVALFGLALLGASYWIRNVEFRVVLMYTLQGLGIACVLYYVLFSRASIAEGLRVLLESGPMLLIGRMSYSIYLWHLPILKMAEHVWGARPLVYAGAAVTSLGASALSYFLVERHLLGLRQKFGSHAK